VAKTSLLARLTRYRRRMRRLVLLVCILAVTSGSAAAQPGQSAPGWGPPPMGSGYHLLTAEERALLHQGEIETGHYIAGGVVGSVFAYGTGHAVQGRFADKGWIFLVGEAVSTGLIIKFLVDCLEVEDGGNCEDDVDWLVVGLIGSVGFRIWELVDLWAGPPRHNARIRAIRARAGIPGYGLYLAPSVSRGDSGGVAGLTLRF
jgi:hypothetical protein